MITVHTTAVTASIEHRPEGSGGCRDCVRYDIALGTCDHPTAELLGLINPTCIDNGFPYFVSSVGLGYKEIAAMRKLLK